jgi:hypothetical protein
VICHDELTFGNTKMLDCRHEFHTEVNFVSLKKNVGSFRYGMQQVLNEMFTSMSKITVYKGQSHFPINEKSI